MCLWRKHDSDESVIIDCDLDVSSSTITEDEHTHHEEYKNDDNGYRDEDLCVRTNSNILCQDDEYFTNCSTLESELLPSETLLLESSKKEQDFHESNKDVLYVCHQTNTDSESIQHQACQVVIVHFQNVVVKNPKFKKFK